MLFLQQNIYKFRSKMVCLHSSNKETFQTSLLVNLETDTGLYDETLEKLAKITTEMFYHKVCRNEFRNKKTSSVKKPVRSSWHASRENYF